MPTLSSESWRRARRAYRGRQHPQPGLAVSSLIDAEAEPTIIGSASSFGPGKLLWLESQPDLDYLITEELRKEVAKRQKRAERHCGLAVDHHDAEEALLDVGLLLVR